MVLGGAQCFGVFEDTTLMNFDTDSEKFSGDGEPRIILESCGKEETQRLCRHALRRRNFAVGRYWCMTGRILLKAHETSHNIKFPIPG